MSLYVTNIIYYIGSGDRCNKPKIIDVIGFFCISDNSQFEQTFNFVTKKSNQTFTYSIQPLISFIFSINSYQHNHKIYQQVKNTTINTNFSYIG